MILQSEISIYYNSTSNLISVLYCGDLGVHDVHLEGSGVAADHPGAAVVVLLGVEHHLALLACLHLVLVGALES